MKVLIIMNEKNCEVREIKIKDLISFRFCSSEAYQGEKLELLLNSIERLRMMNPIIVHPVVDGKYEIICGHNRTKAMEVL